MRKIISFLLITGLLFIAAPFRLSSASGSTLTTFGRKQLSSNLQTVPDSTTALSTTDTWIFQMTIVNTTASAATFTLADRATSPKTVFAAVSIPANTTALAVWPEGLKMVNGATWSTGTTSAITASLTAFQIP